MLIVTIQYQAKGGLKKESKQEYFETIFWLWATTPHVLSISLFLSSHDVKKSLSLSLSQNMFIRVGQSSQMKKEKTLQKHTRTHISIHICTHILLQYATWE